MRPDGGPWVCRSAATGLDPHLVDRDLSATSDEWTCFPLSSAVELARAGYYVTKILRLLG